MPNEDEGNINNHNHKHTAVLELLLSAAAIITPTMVLLPLTLINIDVVVLVGLINCIVMTVLIRCLLPFLLLVYLHLHFSDREPGAPIQDAVGMICALSREGTIQYLSEMGEQGGGTKRKRHYVVSKKAIGSGNQQSITKSKKKATTAGFEPAHSESNRLAIYRLNHSATLSCVHIKEIGKFLNLF